MDAALSEANAEVTPPGPETGPTVWKPMRKWADYSFLLSLWSSTQHLDYVQLSTAAASSERPVHSSVRRWRRCLFRRMWWSWNVKQTSFIARCFIVSEDLSRSSRHRVRLILSTKSPTCCETTQPLPNGRILRLWLNTHTHTHTLHSAHTHIPPLSFIQQPWQRSGRLACSYNPVKNHSINSWICAPLSGCQGTTGCTGTVYML